MLAVGLGGVVHPPLPALPPLRRLRGLRGLRGLRRRWGGALEERCGEGGVESVPARDDFFHTVRQGALQDAAVERARASGGKTKGVKTC